MAVSRTRWAGPAARAAVLKYGPQREALLEALQQAKQTYGDTVRAGRSSAVLTKQATEQAKPLIQQIFQGANTRSQSAQALAAQALGGLAHSPALDAYRAAQAGEAGQQGQQLAARQASDEARLHQQGVAAAAGQQFNQTNARQVLQRAVGQILAKKQGLAGQEGDFTASEADKLAHEAETLEQKERQAQRTADVAQEGNRVSATNAQRSDTTTRRGQDLTRQSAEESGGAAGNYTAPGVKRLTADQHNSARDTIETIRHEAYEQRTLPPGQRLNFNHAKQYLQTAIKGVHPAYPDNGRLKAGLELAYFGGLSDGTIKQLHREGLSVKQLGYPRYRKVNGTPRLEKV